MSTYIDNSTRFIATIEDTRLYQGEETYTQYKLKVINTSTKKETCLWKRYNDFYNLYKKLCEQYPDLSKSVEFPATSWFFKYSQSTIEYRRETLDKFMKFLLTHDIYSRDETVLDFIGVFLEKRKEESSRILSKFPDRIPVICVQHEKSTIPMEKRKFLVPHTLTVNQFASVIRKRLSLDDADSDVKILLYTVNGRSLNEEKMADLYQEEKNEDGFLYIVYLEEKKE